MKYFENYKEIKEFEKGNIRKVFRNFAIDGLSFIDKISGVDVYLNKPRVQFLYIHHIFKDEEIKLRRLLEVLSKHHTFISYSEGVERIKNCNIDKPYIVFSTDDGFKNNINAGKIFSDFGVSACFFINPQILDCANYETIVEHCKTHLHFPPVEFLNWNEINYLQKLGHEIGSHTMNHKNIAQTNDIEIVNDMKECFDIIKKNCGEVKHFAFPYGRFSDFNEIGRKACFESGYISCASAERGCHVNHYKSMPYDEICILRDHVILDWKLTHILYFLVASSKKCSPQNNVFPKLN